MARRSLLLSLFIVLSLVLAACGPNVDDGGADATPQAPAEDGAASPPEDEASPPEDGEASPPEDGEASPGEDGEAAQLEASGDIFAHGVSYETTDSHSSVRVDVFMEQYPDVNVEFSESGFDAQVFLAALQGGDAPDVVRMPRNIIGSYIHRGVLAPIDDCIERAGVDTSNYYEPALNQLTVDGQLYGLPDFYNSVLWLVNDVAFEEANLDPAEFDWSDWDAITEANQQILQAEGGSISRIGIDPKIPGFLVLWAAANGGALLSEDGLTSQLNSPEVVEALEFTAGLIEAHGGGTAFSDFLDDPEVFGDPFGAENQYVKNTVGAQPWEQFLISALAGNSPDAPVSAHAFLSRDGDPITLQSGDALAIVADSDNQDAACAFITAVVSTEAWVRAAETRQQEREEEGVPYLGVYSANIEATEEVFGTLVDLSDTPNFEEAVDIVIENRENAVAPPPSPAGEECDQAVQDAVDSVIGGEDPAGALETAHEECQQAIDDAAQQ